ncbi:UNVERIFIED_CONTAM: hypothetical protein K2H54_031550 [Gekko kuhli]
MARPAGEEAQSRRRGESPAASRLLVSFQYVHVQLGGGAPWGFTLRGGLEHGEPLIVSKGIGLWLIGTGVSIGFCGCGGRDKVALLAHPMPLHWHLESPTDAPGPLSLKLLYKV